MDYGYLHINIRTAAGALPVEGALVTVTGFYEGNGTPDIISVTRSDASGNVPEQTLFAPDRSLSLSPSYSKDGEKVYSLYGIIVEKDGYNRAEDNEIIIFAGVTSVKTFLLMPNIYRGKVGETKTEPSGDGYLL